MQVEYILEMTGITKRFSGVTALDNVEFRLKRGEIHALIGENGAGKSTLMKILMGIHQSDAGRTIYKGKPFQAASPKYAQEHGISMIYQEFNLVPDLTVAENIFVAREPRRFGGLLIDDRAMVTRTRTLLDSLNLNIPPMALVKNLSVAEKQMVEIAKALLANSDILILDEPTSALSEKEVNKLFEILRKLREKGVAIIYISHRLEEFNRIIDRATVFRDGKYIATDEWNNLGVAKLIALMVGRSLTEQYPARQAKIGDVVLEIDHFKNKSLKDVSLKVRAGEIVGLSGMMGAGRTELARAIFGADSLESGTVRLDGKQIRIHSPEDAISHKIAYLPEDRRKDGLMLGLDVAANILVASLGQQARHGIVNDKKCGGVVNSRISELAIKTASTRQLVKYLSGGNQQKVLVGRWLCRDSRVIIFDEPTRGIDVGAKHEIFLLINRMAEAGAAVIMISSEMPEILGMSDRIAVMCEGRLVGEVDAKDANQEIIMQMASDFPGKRGE